MEIFTMKKLLKISGLVGVLLFVLTGCGVTPIKNLKTPITNKTNKLKEIESYIVYGATSTNWDIIKINDNLLKAKYIKGNSKHIAYVNIPFNANEYKIEYANSINLKYNKNKNTIHGAYNKWIKVLKESIDNSINNKLVFYGEVKKNFSDYVPTNEYGNPYKIYYHKISKFNYNKKEAVIIRAKDGYGFFQIGQKKLLNEFTAAFKFAAKKQVGLIDYIVTKKGKYEIVLAGPDARINTIIFDVKEGHEYLFDYSKTDDKLAYWIQDLTENKQVKFKTNTAFRDRAFFFGKSKKKE